MFVVTLFCLKPQLSCKFAFWHKNKGKGHLLFNSFASPISGLDFIRNNKWLHSTIKNWSERAICSKPFSGHNS